MGVRADLSRAPSDTWGVRPCPPRLTKMPDNPEIWKGAAMADQFDKMQKLPDPLPGAPNFHRIPGYKVYMCGQPTLEKLASGDFKENLGKIIHDIYQTAHLMFSDMPQGDHKKRAKYRFASKTLMRILPAPVKAEVEGFIEKKTISLDLYEILGKCTWKPV